MAARRHQNQQVIKIDAPPPPPLVKPYPDLDAIFGHVFSNLIGEPLTPPKIAIFYLIRILFQTHFGFRHMRSTQAQFTSEEKAKIFHWLYALITYDDAEEELSYESFRMILRMKFGNNRNIALNFMTCMEQIGSGATGVNFGIEDEFYSHRYAKDPSRHPNDPIHVAREQMAQEDLKFSSQYSFVYRWLKRILAQSAKTPSSELFEISKMMREWVTAGEESVSPTNRLTTVLPREIDCSLRARAWVTRNISILQKNPTEADRFDHILNYVKLIRKYQPDVYESHLLESIVHVQMKDAQSAIKAMKLFFIDSMFQLNENMNHCHKTKRLGVPSQAPLMYAPILEARICRWFGDFTTARLLLNESIQQSQLRQDEVCHQMGNTELHTMDIIGNGPILEDRNPLTTTTNSENPNSDHRIHRKALKDIDDLHGHTRCGPCCPVTEDDFELVAELDSYGMMLMLMKDIVEGHYRLKYQKIAETGIACPVGADLQERGRKVSNYGHSLMCSNMIRNGLFRHGRTTALEMLIGNGGQTEEETFQTESFAVASANLAYSYAAQGQYAEAISTLSEMRRKFPEDLTWQSARHTVICESIIKFEMSFMMNKYKEALNSIVPLAQYSSIEYSIRRALVLCALGRHREGILLLKSLTIRDVCGKLRCHLQLASAYTANNSFELAIEELEKAAFLANSTNFLNIKTMIGRRFATVLMCRKDYRQAIHHINRIHQDIEQHGTLIEKCCFYLTAAKCHRLSGRDSRVWLKMARALGLRQTWPTMEKAILAEIGALHDETGLFPDRQKLGHVIRMYEAVECDHPGYCQWLLI